MKLCISESGSHDACELGEDDEEGCRFGLLRVGAGLKERRKGSWRLVLLIGLKERL
jgi:hypothetical protein